MICFVPSALNPPWQIYSIKDNSGYCRLFFFSFSSWRESPSVVAATVYKYDGSGKGSWFVLWSSQELTQKLHPVFMVNLVSSLFSFIVHPCLIPVLFMSLSLLCCSSIRVSFVIYSCSIPVLFVVHSCFILGPFLFHSCLIFPVPFQFYSWFVPVVFVVHSCLTRVSFVFPSRFLRGSFVFHSCFILLGWRGPDQGWSVVITVFLVIQLPYRCCTFFTQLRQCALRILYPSYWNAIGVSLYMGHRVSLFYTNHDTFNLSPEFE